MVLEKSRSETCAERSNISGAHKNPAKDEQSFTGSVLFSKPVSPAWKEAQEAFS